MTSREPSHRPLHDRLARHHREVQRAVLTRHALRAAAFAILFMTLAVAAGMWMPVGPGTAWARLVVVIAATVLAVVQAVRAFRAGTPAYDAFLESVEQRFPQIRSWLRNALDFEREPPAHGSIELARAVADRTAERLVEVPVAHLTPRVEPRRPTFMILGALVAIVLLGVASPVGLQRSWTTLWNPALAAPPVTLAVVPGDVELTPGAALAVRARIWGTAARPNLVRDGSRDDAATLEGTDDDGARVWRFDLSQLTREQQYKVRVSHVESPAYTISMVGEPQPLSFTFEYVAPDYARLPVQRGASTRGDLAALAGSEARVEVTFDRDLESVTAVVSDADPEDWTAVTPRRWSGTIPVRTDGSYRLDAKAPSGEGSYAYRISALGDAPPILTVITPEGDMDLPAGQLIPLEIIGQDDLGLSQLRLQYRKDPSAEWTTRSLSNFGDEPREARVSSRWDASQLALLPGETATFRFELFDGNRVTGPGRAVSPTFELRFPSMAELYDDIEGRQETVQKSLEDVADRAKELQESLEKLARQQVQSNPRSQPSFERSEEMKKALERQQELSKQIDEATEELRESLEDAAEREAFDEELQRKLRELNALMEQIQSQELREAMQRMQEALENMDQNQLERNLPNLQQQNEEMLAQLDRSIELLKRLREEERLQALAERAEELKRQQDRLNEQHARDESEQKEGENESSEDSKSEENQDGSEQENESNESKEGSDEKNLAERQEQAAERTEQLAKDMQEMSESLSEQSESEELDQMAEELEKQAAEEQRQAAEQQRQQQGQKAQQSGQKASQKLGDVAMQMQRMIEQRQQAREGVDLAALRRSAKDLVSLQRAAEGNLEQPHDSPGRADRQTDLAEGVARVADSLYTLAQRTPFITQQLAQSLGRAMQDLEDSGRELGQGNRRNGENLGKQGAQSLTEAILELRKSEDAMCNNPAGGGGSESQSTAERLGEVGERQSRVNGETRSLAQRLSEQMKMSAGDQAEMERIAEQQAEIRRRLKEIQEDDEEEQKLLGRLDAAEREMEEVEEALREGTVPNDLAEKQQRILSRLLDAQRSVHRRDYDPEREAERAQDVLQPSPPELSDDLLKQSDRLRLDMLKAESDRYPSQYRAFIEAYLRSLNGTRQ